MDEKIQVYGQIRSILEKNHNDWNIINQFKASYDEFVFNTNNLKEIKFIYDNDLSKLEKELIRQKKDLKTNFNLMLKLLQLYAADNRKTKLTKKLEKIRESLEHLLKEDLNKKVREICDYSEKKLNPELNEEWTLSGYGVNASMINGLRSTSDKYLETWKILKDENEKIKKAGREIRKMITRNDAIVTKRMKKFMGLFKNTHPEFYFDFMNECNKMKSSIGNQVAESEINIQE